MKDILRPDSRFFLSRFTLNWCWRQISHTSLIETIVLFSNSRAVHGSGPTSRIGSGQIWSPEPTRPREQFELSTFDLTQPVRFGKPPDLK